MTAFLLMGIAIAILGAWVAFTYRRRRKTPAELRGDWWDGFERDFYAYVCRKPSVASKDETWHGQDGPPAL